MSSMTVNAAMQPVKGVLAAAAADAARGALILGRGAIGLAGIASLMVAIALLGSESVRERAIELARAAVPAAAPAGPEAERADAEPAAQRWAEWLASGPAGAIAPAQENVTRYLSRRYRVAENAVRHIVVEAFRVGHALGVDPLLILAVTAVESSLNPFAQSPVGAQGLMQVLTRVHSDKFEPHGGELAALDPIANLRVGSQILGDLIRRGGSVERGLQLYVGAGNLPDDGGYADRVLGEMARIRMAAGGEVRQAQSDGRAADTARRAGAVPTAATQVEAGRRAI